MRYGGDRIGSSLLVMCLAVAVSGCTYEAIRRSERMECQRIIDDRERLRCLERWEDDQEAYDRKRKEIEEDEQ